MREQLARLRSLGDSQREYRDQCLNLIASENTPSPFVEGMIVEALNRRYGFYNGSDPDNQHYRGTKQVAKLEKLAQENDDLLAVLETDNRLEAVRDALAQHKAEELLAFFADSQEDESAPLEHPSVDRRFPPKRRRPADA